MPIKDTEPYRAKCPACGNEFIAIREKKEKKIKLQCPKCTTRFKIRLEEIETK